MAFLWNKRLVSPRRVNKPEETPDTTYRPRSNPMKNVVLSIYERHQEVFTLPENSIFVIILKFDVSVVYCNLCMPYTVSYHPFLLAPVAVI